MHKIDRCEVCENTNLKPILDLGDQPMCDDLVPIGSDARPKAYPLQLLLCSTCLTVHQALQVEKQLLFPKTYHYRAALTQDVLAGMEDLVGAIESHVGGLEGKQVLDIGCNDGSLLRAFGRRGAKTAGIEPTGASEDARKHVELVIQSFFDAGAVIAYLEQRAKPDVITFTNVFAHIEDLNGVIANLRALLKPDTKLVIENHYLGAVISRNQFDTFYHEHPRTYSFKSFQFIADKLGLRLESVEFPPRYNGNIRVIMGSGARGATPQLDEQQFVTALESMAGVVERSRTQIHEQLRRLAGQHGPLPGKAFPGRAAILVHCFGVDAELVDTVYERSSSPKVGHYIPGTRIEIRDEAEFFANRLQSPVLVNFAWHIHDEISRYLVAHGYRGQIIPLFQ